MFDNVSSSLLINQVIKDILEDKKVNLENLETKFTILIDKNWDKLSDLELKILITKNLKIRLTNTRDFIMKHSVFIKII